MDDYRGYAIEVERVRGKWRCLITPTRLDFPILRNYARIYETEAEALADAKRRVDRLFCLA